MGEGATEHGAHCPLDGVATRGIAGEGEHLEAAIGEEAKEAGPAEGPDVGVVVPEVADGIKLRPLRRDVDQEQAARAKDTAGLAHEGDGLTNVLQDLLEPDSIEHAARERQIGAAADHARELEIRPDKHRLSFEVERCRPEAAVAGAADEVTAAGANVEQARARTKAGVEEGEVLVDDVAMLSQVSDGTLGAGQRALRKSSPARRARSKTIARGSHQRGARRRASSWRRRPAKRGIQAMAVTRARSVGGTRRSP